MWNMELIGIKLIGISPSLELKREILSHKNEGRDSTVELYFGTWAYPVPTSFYLPSLYNVIIWAEGSRTIALL